MHLTLDWTFLCENYGAGYISKDQPRHYTWSYQTPKPSMHHHLGFWTVELSTNITIFLALRSAVPVNIRFCDFLRTSPNLHQKPFLHYPGESLGYSPLPCCGLNSVRASLRLVLANHLHVTSQVCPSYGPKEQSSLVGAVDPAPYWQPGRLSADSSLHIPGYLADCLRLPMPPRFLFWYLRWS